MRWQKAASSGPARVICRVVHSIRCSVRLCGGLVEGGITLEGALDERGGDPQSGGDGVQHRALLPRNQLFGAGYQAEIKRTDVASSRRRIPLGSSPACLASISLIVSTSGSAIEKL